MKKKRKTHINMCFFYLKYGLVLLSTNRYDVDDDDDDDFGV